MDISNLSAGMIVEDTFAILKVEQHNSSAGKKFLKAELSHKTGSLNAKVWEESMPTAPLEANKVYRISGKIDAYKGNLGLVITQAWLIEDEKIEDHLKPRKTLIFDIETAGPDFETLDEWSQNYLLTKLQYHQEDKEKAKESTALYPLFGQVVAIGMFNPVTQKGQVLVQGKSKVDLDDPKFEVKYCVSEGELLTSFWNIAVKFEHFVTFNGNNFDWPYLVLRSAINHIKISFEITRSKEQQTDLMEKFKGIGTYSLEALCRVFGISNPKEKGVSGLHVSKLFEKGKVVDIANYVARDVSSTTQLYDIWKNYMAGKIVL